MQWVSMSLVSPAQFNGAVLFRENNIKWTYTVIRPSVLFVVFDPMQYSIFLLQIKQSHYSSTEKKMTRQMQ